MESRPYRDEENVPEEVGGSPGGATLDGQGRPLHLRVRVLIAYFLNLRVHALTEIERIRGGMFGAWCPKSLVKRNSESSGFAL